MRSVMVTPSNIPPYLQSALRLLHESRVMECFGMFFVDDLDLDNMECINGNLGGQDGDEIKQDQKAALATRVSPKKDQRRGIQLTESHRTADYPWGKTITWTMLQRLLKDHAVDFMRPFDFHHVDMGLGNFHILESLFTDFTRETWLGLHESFVPAGIRPCPVSLKDSMGVWTCQNIVACLAGRCLFLPSTQGLEGAPKSKESDLSFKSLRLLLFPAPGQSFKENTIWAAYSENKKGYIGKYWEILEKDDEVEVDALHDGIDQVFEQLQCLPQVRADSNIWHATGGAVCFLTNPRYYQIEAVSTTARKANIGPQRPQVTVAELRNRLDPHFVAGKKRKKTTNRKKTTSIKRKNHRNPPKKRQKINQPLLTQTKPTTATSRPTRESSRRALDQGRTSNSETADSLSSEMDRNSRPIYSSNSESTTSSESGII